ncbi:hypothetical protein FRC01_012690 [Tulasnella sp. 417]|nr:hypothetical protein FRC01_012690 [Tulasnella sp. 417]
MAMPLMFTVPHTRLESLSFLKRGIEGYVPFNLNPSVDTRALIASILRRRWDRAEVDTTPPRPISLLEAGLVSRRLITLPQPVVTRESQNIVNIPPRSLPLEENGRPATKSFGNLPTAQAPPPTKAAVVPTSTHHTNALSAAVPLYPPSIAVNPFQRVSSDFILKANAVFVDESAKRSAPVPNPTFLSHRWNKAEVVTVLPTSTDSSEPAVAQDGPPSLVEPLSVHQSKDVAHTSPLFSPFGERTHGETISTETPPTPKTPQPTNPSITLASPPNKSGFAAVTLPPLCISVSASHRTSSEAIFTSDSGSGDEKAKYSTSNSDPTTTVHPAVILATQLNGTVLQGGSLQTSCSSSPSSATIPSLPVVPDDSESEAVNNVLPFLTPRSNNLLRLPAAAEVHGIVTRDCSLGRARYNIAVGSAPHNASGKTPGELLDIIDPAGWKGKSLGEIAADLRKRAAATVRQSANQAILTPSFFSSGRKTPLISGSPAPNQPGPVTSIEGEEDHPRKTGAPNPSSDSGLESPNCTPTREAEAVVQNLPDGEAEETVPDPVSHPVPLSTDIIADVVQISALPRPPPFEVAPEKIKGASRTKKVIKKVVKRVKATFRPKNRSQVTGDN